MVSLVISLGRDTYQAGRGPPMLQKVLALWVKSLPSAKQRLVVRDDKSRLKVTPVVREILTCLWCLGVGAVA